MSFLAPLFVLGLTALLVPVFIHLTQRERKTVVEFPSLMFLKKIPYESVQRRRIRDWLLLMLRLAALAAVVMAFARPFLRNQELVAAPNGAREVIVLLDRSYSMGFAGTWARAQQAAAQAIGDTTPSDRLSVVVFADAPEVAVRSTPDRSRAIAEINAASPGPGATKYGPALKLAGSMLAESLLPRKEVFLVSDFQRAGWQADSSLRLPGGATLTPIPVDGGDGVNLALTPVSMQRVPFEGQVRVAVTAGVLNRGDDAVTDVAVQLEMDGRIAQTMRVAVAPHASVATTFTPLAVTAPNTRASVRLGEGGAPSPDALARDNTFYFVLSPAAPLPVMVVGQGGRDEASLYLTRALSIGTAPKFDMTMQSPDALVGDTLARSRVLILNDVAVSEAMATRLIAFVEGGGGLWMTLGSRAVWPSARETWLPVALGTAVDRTRGPAAKLSAIDYGHQIFEPFRAPRSGDFASARFYSYRALSAAKDATVLARFDTGEPALVERAPGRGRVVVFASTLDLSWNDLALKPVFLPFVHQVSRRLSNYREQPPWLTVGQVLDVAGAEAAAGLSTTATSAAPRTVLSPSGQRRDLVPTSAAPASPAAGSTPAAASASSVAATAFELSEQGFYEIRGAGREAGPVIVTAANVDLNESNLDRIDPKELVAAVSTSGTAGSTAGQDVLPDEAQELAQRVWWYLLFAGILLLIAETVFADRASRAMR
ncbi:MAG: BatA domain-containing protein [Vicinamibacterales bacterium]